MAYIKVTTRDGAISRFVDESKETKILALQRDFGGQPELDEKGGLKKYTAEEVSSYGRSTRRLSAEEIFGVKPTKGATIPKGE